ncbi:hypothetical protein UlMin_023958 [Ulmus minor]
MGTCLSKKKVTSSSAAPSSYATGGHINGVSGSSAQAKVADSNKPKAEKQEQEEEKPVEEEATQVVKKEIFVIKHRKSHDDRERNSKNSLISQQKESSSSSLSSSSSAAIETANAQIVEKASSTPMAAGVRTSSCTKEEVDAILIQCGRLSRSSSGNAASSSASCERGRKYSGSKRSFDFDNCDNNEAIAAAAATDEEKPRHRNRSRTRQSTRASPSPQGRRRTPSRERDNQRSSSRERRVSRSPGKQRGPENGGTTATTSANVSGSSANCNRPGKMVSVPATVSSLVMDKSNNGGSSCGEIKRISVKRNVGGGGGEAAARSAASPRYQSPTRANGKASNEAQQPQPQPSLSRNSSRKAEQSPYRRNPLSEIDPNTLAYPQANNNKIQNKNKREIEVDEIVVMEQSHVSNQNPNSKSSRVTKEQAMVETNIVTSDGLKPPQTLTRTRSSRRSRDFDINPEATLSNPTPSYTRLLLEDIQNFHQKSTNPVAVSLPPCVSKACSILEAVADLNSTTTSILSEQSNVVGKNMKEPFVESEVMMGSDDLTEPSFHKYVTVRRGGTDMEDQESSGSNSFVGGGSQNPNWGFSSSSWEPNSAESTDCWTGGWRSGVGGEEAAGGRSNTPVRFDTGGGVEGEGGKKMSGKKRESGQRSGGIGRGRLGVKGLHTISMAAST